MKRFYLLIVFATMMTGSLWADNKNDTPKGIELSNDERKLVNQNNAFAFNLFRTTRGSESQVLSPLSITYALGLLNNGAAGETQKEINQVLGFGEAGAAAINQFCRKIKNESAALDELTKVMIANTIFFNQNKGYVLFDDFLQKANEYYDASPEIRPFDDGKTIDAINQWAGDHTEQMIQKVLDDQSFDPDAVSYLLNAIYFKGAWTLKFDKNNTYDEPFDGRESIPMMHMTNNIPYYNAADYQVLVLPYGNQSYQMNIILPHEGKTIEEVLNQIDGKNWKNDFIDLETFNVDLKLPKFEIDTDIELNDIMAELGMPRAFDMFLAEFPNFCDYPVYISLMKQVAKIKTDEEGTEAAAITVIGVKDYATPEEPEKVKFYADRPFIYVISEHSTGTIFFIGQYTGKGSTTEINPVRLSPASDQIYNLCGQRLSQQPQKGVYIQNGQKRIANGN